MVKLYLSGPMRNLPDFNFAEFNRIAKIIRFKYEVWLTNPAESFGGRKDLSRAEYMRKDIESLLKVDGIVMMDGWENSKGATLELEIAKELGLKLFRWNDELGTIINLG